MRLYQWLSYLVPTPPFKSNYSAGVFVVSQVFAIDGEACAGV